MSSPKSLFAKALGLAALGMALAFGVALLAGWSFGDIKRETRIALGLPKLWNTNFNEDTVRWIEMACPDGDPIVVVTGGQSNAANSFGKPEPSDPNSPNVMFFDGKCYPLASPVLGATTLGQSMWPALGDRLTQAYDRPVVFINGAVGMSQVSDWVDRRSGYLSKLTQRIAEAKTLGFEPDLVLWIQGETDAAIQVDPAGFARDLGTIVTEIEREGEMAPNQTPWVLYRSTECHGRENNGADLEAAMAAMTADPSDNLYLGPSLTVYPPELRLDGCHLNLRGQARLIEETMQFVREKELIDTP